MFQKLVKLSFAVVMAVALFAVSGPTEAGIIAGARGDYVAGINEGDPPILPATGTGTWYYMDSATPNPADSGILNLLYWKISLASYTQFSQWPAANAVDLQRAGLVDEIRVHPSYLSPRFAVVRWEAGAGEGGLINITGTIRKVDVGGGDGVSFEIFVDGNSIFNTTLAGTDGTGFSFDQNSTITEGSTVDFVVGPRGSDAYDGTGLRAIITLLDGDGDGFPPPADCDDTDAFINPDATELPGNFEDENCDGDLGSCDPCLDWRNHGQYVLCVAQDAESLIMGGFITEEEGDALVSSSAQSSIGKKNFVPEGCGSP